ncbi:MAG: Holliday junction resolvase RuvX [Steroidobacteraceae bacterium]|jgi:putative Holliday junction resolvase
MPERAPRVILAFDFGLRRIGIAAGNTISEAATPLGAAPATPAGPDWPTIDRHLKHYQPGLLIVGRPYNVDGSIGQLEAAAAEFAAALAARAGRPVERVDERYSSLEASALLKEARAAGTRGRIQRADIDGLAAAILLERYLRGERDGPG